MLSTLSTSPPKSACPGVSMMLILTSLYLTAVFLDRIVIPRSRSKSLESRIRSYNANKKYHILPCSVYDDKTRQQVPLLQQISKSQNLIYHLSHSDCQTCKESRSTEGRLPYKSTTLFGFHIVSLNHWNSLSGMGTATVGAQGYGYYLHCLILAEYSRLLEHTINKSGLSMINMGNNSNISNVITLGKSCVTF